MFSERSGLIKQIEELRGSKVITYFLADRQNVSASMAEDAVRPMYEHLRRIGPAKKIDLFLYSRGGNVDVPWKLITMLREYGKDIGTLIPYHAHSAATLMAIGCDEIVMGPKGELGPIDPALTRTKIENGQRFPDEVRVEDVMSYVSFLRDKGGLGDQSAIAKNIHLLAQELTPQTLGSIYRIHSHIRMVARMMLMSRNKIGDDQTINLIVDTLAEKIYLHGHSVGRKEATDIGLPVKKPDDDLEEKLWRLLRSYEDECSLRIPFDAEAILAENDERKEDVRSAFIESVESSTVFAGTYHLRRIRQMPSPITVNLNLNFPLPPQLNPEQITPAIQQQMQQIQQQLLPLVQQQTIDQIRLMSPAVRVEVKPVGFRWRENGYEDDDLPYDV